MKILNRTFTTPEENLACDEALLDAAEEGQLGEVLRFWSPRNPFVVLGYSGKVSEDVNLEACLEKKIPVFRRVSGGGTVLQGAGCLNYSLVLNIEKRPDISGITSTNYFIMNHHRVALFPLTGPQIQVCGITDLALGELKFSGNAQRRKKNFILFHGTFLLNFDLDQISDCLALPPRQPDYRKNRPHKDFLVNLALEENAVKKALVDLWGAAGELDFSLSKRIDSLIEDHYSKKEWNFKF